MFSSLDDHLVEAVYKKHGFDTAIDILLYSTQESETKAVSVSTYNYVLCSNTLMYMLIILLQTW